MIMRLVLLMPEMEINNKHELDEAIQSMASDYAQCRQKGIVFTAKWSSPMSRVHFSSLHVWLDMTAERLNAHGLTVKSFINKSRGDFDPHWTKEIVKDLIFKPTAFACFGKDSTTKLTSKECCHVSSVLFNHFSKSTHLSDGGIQLPEWPSKR